MRSAMKMAHSPESDAIVFHIGGASGGVGGVFGLVALPVELPLSTALMLRSISDIARSEGHNLKDPVVQLGCLEVLLKVEWTTYSHRAHAGARSAGRMPSSTSITKAPTSTAFSLARVLLFSMRAGDQSGRVWLDFLGGIAVHF